MKRISKLGIPLVIVSLILICNINSLAQKTDCSKITDAQIAARVRSKLRVAHRKQMKHVRVSSKNGVVTLSGRVGSKKTRARMAAIAKSVRCVKRVVVRVKVTRTLACGPGTKACNGLCIPIKQPCIN